MPCLSKTKQNKTFFMKEFLVQCVSPIILSSLNTNQVLIKNVK